MDVSAILSEFLKVSTALSTEKDTTKLLEYVLLAAKRLSQADGGTIYSVNAKQELVFDTLFNDTLNLHMGGSSGNTIPFSSIPIYINGQPNVNAVVAHSAAKGKVINIPDVYNVSEYDMTSAKAMDKHNGYKTLSILTVPMNNHEGDLIGVLQLINAQEDDEVIPFSRRVERTVIALASLGSVALTNRQLIDDMGELFEAFTQLIAKAIDEKSPYTGGHCRRVPELTMMIAEAVHRHSEGPMASFTMTEADRVELNLAGWIHDCGKVATPEYVMDKSTKLETVFDRIAIIEHRFEVAKRDVQIAYLQKIAASLSEASKARLNDEMTTQIAELDEAFSFVKQTNIGGEYMSNEAQQKLEAIADLAHVTINGQIQPLLSDNEIYNLRTARGTLNPEEREIINRHMDITCEMLDALPFPKHLARVPEFAGGHHEKMDGTGYPKGLTREQMSIPARMMAIADIFEALTAADRPYKEAKKLSECLFIMGKMKEDQHIDPDLFDIFIKEKVYLEYAKRFLKPNQIDNIDWANIPGVTREALAD